MTFEQIKAKMLEILKKQASEELHDVQKALSVYEGLAIAKGGRPAGIGEVRVWKGKKYRKLAPKKWRRIYESADKNARRSINIALKRVKNATTLEDLMHISLVWKSRFKDETGVDLPILDELRKALDEKNEELSKVKQPLPIPEVRPDEKKDVFSRIRKELDKTVANKGNIKQHCDNRISYINEKIKDFQRMPFDAKARQLLAISLVAKEIWQNVRQRYA